MSLSYRLPKYSGKPRVFIVLGITLLLVACGGEETGEPTAVSSSGNMSSGDASTPAKSAVSSRPVKLSGPDIAGLFIGMTPAQVQAAFKDEKPPTKSQVMQKTISYSVLGQRMKTEPFISNLIAQYNEPNAQVTLEAGVAPPPDGGLVISVGRSHRQDLQRLPRADYRAALIEKYGKPTYEKEVNQGTGPILEMTWLLSDGVQCMRHPTGMVFGDSIKAKIRNPQGDMWNPEAKNEEDCANYLVYQLWEDPVRLAKGVMWDVKKDLEAQVANEQWIADKQAEKSAPGSGAPKL